METKSFEYLTILLSFLVITIFLEHKYKPHLYHSRKERLLLTGLFFIIGITWDTFAVWRGHWAFPKGNTINLRIGLLPLEEYLFFLITPYFSHTVYKIIDEKNSNIFSKVLRRIFNR